MPARRLRPAQAPRGIWAEPRSPPMVMSPRAQPAPATDGSALRSLPVDLRLMRLGIRVLLALALLALLLGGWQMLSRASWLAQPDRGRLGAARL